MIGFSTSGADVVERNSIRRPERSTRTLGMIFGDSVESADTVAPAEWIGGACRGASGTVGALVPNQYSAVLRVHAPAPGIQEWWSAYRRLFQVVAAVGERHTSSPDRAWFGVWEGHGFDTRATRIALREVPRFDVPHREYYLLTGPVTAATRLQEPGSAERWRRPDLFWPDDHRWFVATDVDFWSLYIGGGDDLISELSRRVPTPCEVVTLDQQLEPED